MNLELARKSPDRSAYHKEWYRKNVERIKLRNAAHYKANREEVLERGRKWSKAHPEIGRKSSERYRLKNIEKCRKACLATNRKHAAKREAYRKIYEQNLPDDVRERRKVAMKAWSKRNVEKRKAYNKAYHLKNKDRHSEDNKKWRRENRDKLRSYAVLNREAARDYAHRRRAIKRGATINLAQIRTWMQAVKSKRMTICYWCSKRFLTSEIHFDHIVPLSKGGPHCIENLCVACGPCNLSKSNKAVRTWTKIDQTFLEL